MKRRMMVIDVDLSVIFCLSCDLYVV